MLIGPLAHHYLIAIKISSGMGNDKFEDGIVEILCRLMNMCKFSYTSTKSLEPIKMIT